jgi:hypothetical protein
MAVRTCAWQSRPGPEHDAGSNKRLVGYVVRRPHRDDIYVRYGRTSYENVIKTCRTLSCCCPVNCAAGGPHRRGNVAKHTKLHASQDHRRSAEASGKAATAGGNAVTRVRSGGTPRGPDIARHSNGDRNADRDAVGCAGSNHGEACPARERGPQLQRWLRIKLQTRQGPVGRMQRIRGVLLSFLGNLQRHTHPPGLRAMRRNQDVHGVGPATILVVLHRHAGWGEIPGHRRESKQVAHAVRDG